VFEAREDEAQQLGLLPRSWPPTVVGHAHWSEDFARAAASGGIDLPLDEAVGEVNAWIRTIDQS
jgi:hypothetical protein